MIIRPKSLQEEAFLQWRFQKWAYEYENCILDPNSPTRALIQRNHARCDKCSARGLDAAQ